jgi:mRNA interferase YafQ
MLEIVQTSKFKKDLKRCRKRGWDMDELSHVVTLLQMQEPIPSEYRNHSLTGDRAGQMDIHIKADWVLLYRVAEELQLLRLERTGSHSDLEM